MFFPNASRPIAGFVHKFRKSFHIIETRKMIRPMRMTIRAVCVIMDPCKNHGAAARACRRSAKGICESNPFRSEHVKIWRFYFLVSVASESLTTMVIRHDQNNIQFFIFHFRRLLVLYKKYFLFIWTNIYQEFQDFQ